MAKFLRCTVPHWRGNEFVAADTIVPAGDKSVIPEFYAEFEVDEPEPAKPVARKKA